MAAKSGKDLVNHYLRVAMDLEEQADRETVPEFRDDLLYRAKYTRSLAEKEAANLKTTTPAKKPRVHK